MMTVHYTFQFFDISSHNNSSNYLSKRAKSLPVNRPQYALISIPLQFGKKCEQAIGIKGFDIKIIITDNKVERKVPITRPINYVSRSLQTSQQQEFEFHPYQDQPPITQARAYEAREYFTTNNNQLKKASIQARTENERPNVNKCPQISTKPPRCLKMQPLPITLSKPIKSRKDANLIKKETSLKQLQQLSAQYKQRQLIIRHFIRERAARLIQKTFKRHLYNTLQLYRHLQRIKDSKNACHIYIEDQNPHISQDDAEMSYSYSQDFSSTVRHITIPKPSIQEETSLELSSIAQVEGHYIEVRRRISRVRDISNFERIAENHISEESKQSMNDSESLVQVKASEKEEISGEQIVWQVEQSLTSIRVEQLRNEVRPNSSIRSINSLYQQQIPKKSRTLPGYSLDSQILLDLSCKLSVIKEVTIVKQEVVNLINFKNEQTDCFCIAQSIIEIILEKAFEQVSEKLPIKAGFQGFDSGMYAVDACLEQFLLKNELSIRKQLKHLLNSAQTDTHLDLNDTNQPLSSNTLESIHTRLIHHALKDTLTQKLRHLPQIPSSLLDMKITQLLYDSTRQVQECTRFFGGALPHSELLQEYGITERLEGEKLGALRDERLEMIMEAECARMVREDKREMEQEVERVVREIGEAIMGQLVDETVDIMNNK